jgi:glutamate dehydrogenase/leucine dehydrogenase
MNAMPKPMAKNRGERPENYKKRGSLLSHRGEHELISNKDLLELECDALVPCAVPNAIHPGNSLRVKARVIVEGAHGPVSHKADAILTERDIPVIPDIHANAGGVVPSYFEWVQNRQGMLWLEVVIQKRLRRFMIEAWDAVVESKEKHNVTFRMAANMEAERRGEAADTLRGVYA